MISTRKSIPLALTAITLLAMPVQAQQAVWTSYYQTGIKAYRGGKFFESEKLLKQALQASNNIPEGKLKDNIEAQTLNDLAAVERELGKLAESEELLNKAIPLIEKSGNENAGIMGYVLLNLANIYLSMAKHAEAEELYRKVVSIAEANSKSIKNSSIMALPLVNLANALIDDGKYREATPVLERASAVYDRAKIKKDLYYVGVLAAYSAMYRETGDYKKAEEFGKNAISEADAVVGKNDSFYEKCLYNLATLYVKTGRYKEAESLLNDAGALAQKHFGNDCAEVGVVQGELARTYASQGKYQLAEPLAIKAMATERKVFGDDHPFVAQALLTQGDIFHDQGKYQEAEAVYKQALAMYKKVYSEEHPKVAQSMARLAELYLDQARTSDAEELLQRALAIDKKLLSPDNSDLAEVERLLAVTYKVNGKYEDAEALYKRSIQATEKSLGTEHRQYGAAVRDLGRLYQKQRKFTEAESLFKQSLSIDEKIYGSNSAKVASDLDLLAKLYTEAKEQEKAVDVSKRSNGIKQTLPGSAQLAVLQTSITDNQSKLSQPTKVVADKWALVVGISNFQDPSINLQYAAKDATDFKNFLVAKEQFAPDHVRLLTDKNATREAIITQLGDKFLGKMAGKDDLVVIYLSTHGSGSQEAAGGVNFLVAHDTNKNSLLATGIPMQWMTSIIKEQVHSNRVVIVMDVCHSAAAAPGEKSLVRGDAGVMGSDKPGVDAQKLTLGEGQSLLCSSLADQVSWESKSYPNSVFTKKLMEALQTKGTQTTLTDAYNYLKDAVESEVLRDRSAMQTPILNTKLWTGGDAVVAVKPSKPRKAL